MFIYQIGDLLASHSIPIRHGYCIWGERCLYKLLVGSITETYIQTIKADYWGSNSKGILRPDQKALCEAFPIVSDYHIHPVAIVEASNCSSGLKETYIQTIAMIIYVRSLL